jgi:hypothetical protein
VERPPHPTSPRTRWGCLFARAVLALAAAGATGWFVEVCLPPLVDRLGRGTPPATQPPRPFAAP